MHRHGWLAKTQQTGHLSTCCTPLISAMASGFAWSQITWIVPTQLPTGVCKGLTLPGIKHVPISWCHVSTLFPQTRDLVYPIFYLWANPPSWGNWGTRHFLGSVECSHLMFGAALLTRSSQT